VSIHFLYFQRYVDKFPPTYYIFIATIASITGLEYAFTKVKKHASHLSWLFSSLCQPFRTMALWTPSLFSGVAFWYSVRNLDKREDDLDNLPVGHLDSY